MAHLDTEDVLALLRRVADEVVNPRFGRLGADEVASKRRPGDLVTIADREAEVRLAAELRAAYPDAMVLGEEAVALDPLLLKAFRDADHAFTVDPVDGTRHFAKGSPDHALMLAELRHREVVRSWIWQPQHGRAYVAERGAGAWCDGRRLTPADRPHRRRPTATCCGIDYPRLAEGEAGVAAYLKVMPWDHAPGSLLLTEAGGAVLRPDGSPYQPQGPPRRGLVAATDPATARRLAVGRLIRRP